MGGRSKEPRAFTNPYAFLADLSNERIENYGKYSSAGWQNRDDSTRTQTGIPTNTHVLNARAADEYRRRFGVTPSWDLSSNAGVQHHKEV